MSLCGKQRLLRNSAYLDLHAALAVIRIYERSESTCAGLSCDNGRRELESSTWPLAALTIGNLVTELIMAVGPFLSIPCEAPLELQRETPAILPSGVAPVLAPRSE